MFNKAKPVDSMSHGSDDLLVEVMVRNNRRLFLSFMSILVMGNLATVLIKFTGKGSAYLTYESIALEFLLASLSLIGGFFLSSKLKAHRASSYVSIAGVMLCLIAFQYVIFGATEIFATFYIAFVLSVLYFNRNASLFNFIVIVASQVLLFVMRPELIPVGPPSNLLVRFLVYVWVGVGATAGAAATKSLLELAIAKQKEARQTLENLRKMAHTIVQTIEMLKAQSQEQNHISDELKGISEHQAASLEQISAALDDLASQADANNRVARSLNSETQASVQSVNDLKVINGAVQSGTARIVSNLDSVMDYSSNTSRHIHLSMDKFNTVQSKSGEIAAFVEVINDIAARVNLLSLNASIEAARAGEHGRGFAVVAEEISKLADATARNAKEISNIIRENMSLIDESSSLITESSAMMEKLDSAIVVIKDEIQGVGAQIFDVTKAVEAIENLNGSISGTSRSIEASTNHQKLATEEANRTTTGVSEYAMNIVEVSRQVLENSRATGEIVVQLESLAREMTGHGTLPADGHGAT